MQIKDSPSLYKFFASNEINYISPFSFIRNLIITVLLSLVIAFIYTRFGRNISNRKEFSSNFALLSLTTMFIITIVKSSLALSLGLVGALSIVRFRTAIKDPEELNYLFLSIAIGLGIGANQILITIISVFFILLYIFINGKIIKQSKEQFINLIINLPAKEQYNFDDILETISNYSNYINIKRLTQENDLIESSIYLNIRSFSIINELRNKLIKQYPGIEIDFIDNSNLE
tara:strand:+ start:997 stop:1689 length:693 start_codon:yes stop_codon:yes gene_type:complete